MKRRKCLKCWRSVPRESPFPLCEKHQQGTSPKEVKRPEFAPKGLDFAKALHRAMQPMPRRKTSHPEGNWFRRAGRWLLERFRS